MDSEGQTRGHRMRRTPDRRSQSEAAQLAQPQVMWRRWTGIEPAGRGSLVPTALKAAEPTRYPDTSIGESIPRSLGWPHDVPEAGARALLLVGHLVAVRRRDRACGTGCRGAHVHRRRSHQRDRRRPHHHRLLVRRPLSGRPARLLQGVPRVAVVAVDPGVQRGHRPPGVRHAARQGTAADHGLGHLGDPDRPSRGHVPVGACPRPARLPRRSTTARVATAAGG